MKKLLMFFVALLTLAAATPAHATKRSIMELLLLECDVLIIRGFGIIHHPKHWPMWATVIAYSRESNIVEVCN